MGFVEAKTLAVYLSALDALVYL